MSGGRDAILTVSCLFISRGWGVCNSYVQLFRNGSIESVEAAIIDMNEKKTSGYPAKYLRRN